MPQVTERSIERVSIRWADIDANFHLRHSVYYDLGSQQRINALAAGGLHMSDMQQGGFGPVLFREECRFLKEIKPEDAIDLQVMVTALSRDYRKFAFRHLFMKGEARCAELVVEGAWFDARQRKVFAPPPIVVKAVESIPRSDDFSWLD